MVTVSVFYLVVLAIAALAVGYAIRSAFADVEASALHKAVRLLSEVADHCAVVRALPYGLTVRINQFCRDWGTP